MEDQFDRRALMKYGLRGAIGLALLSGVGAARGHRGGGHRDVSSSSSSSRYDTLYASVLLVTVFAAVVYAVVGFAEALVLPHVQPAGAS